MAIKPDYEAGTVSITNGTTTLTGVNTFWVLAKLQKGDTFKVKNLDAIIEEVVSNTEITLKEAWTGGDLAASTYAIRYQPDGSRFAGAYVEIRDLLANGNLTAFAALVGALDLIPIFTGAGALTLIPKNELIQGVQTDAKVETLAGRIAFDGEAEGFSVLINDVGDGRAAIYFKESSTSGDWSTPAFLTGPNGTFQSKGIYSAASAYVIGDVVLQNGSSWIARVNTTGNAPPTLPTTSNTQWFLLAAAGNGFVFKGDYSEATAYLKDDVVVDQGSSWIALQATTGNAPPILPTTSNAQWKSVAVKGTGDFNGPASSVVDNLVSFNGATGKVGKDSGVAVSSLTLGFIDRTYTSSDTWTKPAGLKKLEVILVGGGGGSGGVAATASTSVSSGGGGGGAVIMATYTDVSILPATVNYTIGAVGVGGSGVTGASGYGTAGGSTTFKLLTAGGGGGGQNQGPTTSYLSSSSGNGGTATSTEPASVLVKLLPGGRPDQGEQAAHNTASVARPGSAGGNALIAGDSAPYLLGAGTFGPVAGKFPGGGAIGVGNSFSQVNRGGANGGAGVIYLREWY